MGSVINFTGKNQKKGASAQQNNDIESPEKDFIEFYDEYGRKMLIPREEWKKSVLPEQLTKHWESADELYFDIFLALNDGFAKEVLDAAKHLKEIDPIKERGYTILAIAYMRNDLLNEAEKTLNEYIKLYGKTGTILINLAKVYYFKKGISKAIQTTWEGLCLDPNQENGIPWWGALNYEAGGIDKYIKSLEKAAAIKGSWMPHIYLARYYLEQREYEKAKPLYKHVINKAKNELPALYIISGDMGNNGYEKEIIDIIAPVYNVNTHDIRTGLNILQAYLQTGNYVEGQKLLNKIMQLKRPDLNEYLMKLSNDFEQMKKNDFKEKTFSGEVEYELAVINRPIWYYGLNSPGWLLPENLADEKIGFITFTEYSPETADSTVQLKDDIGRMTRSLPLLLQEVTLFQLNVESKCIFPVAKGMGPVVSKTEWDKSYLNEVSRKNNLDLLVTGSVSGCTEGYVIKILIFESQTESITTYETMLYNKDKNGEFLKSLNEIVLKIADLKNIKVNKSHGYYKVPSESLVSDYLNALGQSLMQTLIEGEFFSLEGMWGERNILNWYLNLALADFQNPINKIIFVSGLAKSKGYGSEVYKEYRDQAIKLLSEEKSEESPARRLLPFVYFLYDMQEEFKSLLKSAKGAESKA
ncbi:MAG TPA: hypothetical protein VHP38_06345 [Ruminiclostridium sp.]|nr:hypothetical protein [Ruminiclostridium sp.]